MLTKFADNEKRKSGQLRGLVIEHHLRAYITERMPDRVVPPDNEGKWEQFCNHDFKIKTAAGYLLVDVSGPKSNLTFGAYSQKPTGCHYHILARPISMPNWQQVDFSKGIEVIGVVDAQHYLVQINPDDVMGFENWIAMLEV